MGFVPSTERQVIHMAANIAALLDKAISVHRLSSDYKLALVMGVDHKSLSNYRHGKTLPDARIISLLCELTGDDPAILAAEIEAERAKTDEARALWLEIALRLAQTARQGVAAGLFSAVALGGLLSGFPSGNAHAATPNQGVTKIYIVESRRRRKEQRRPRFSRLCRSRKTMKISPFSSNNTRKATHVSRPQSGSRTVHALARSWVATPARHRSAPRRA